MQVEFDDNLSGPLPRPKFHRRSRRLFGEVRYSDDQPRAENGQFGAGGSAAPGSIGEAMSKVTFTGMNQSPMPVSIQHGAAGANFNDMAKMWTSDGSTATRISDAARGKGAGQPEEIKQAGATLRDALNHAPTTTEPMYRGMQVSPTLTRGDAVGKTISMAPSSFSKDDQVAAPYAFDSAASVGAERSAVIKVESGARAVPVGDLSAFPSEKELISSGKFQIDSVRTYPMSNLEDVSGGAARAQEAGITAVTELTVHQVS